MRSTTISILSLVTFAAAACGQSGPSADDLNQNNPPVTGGTSGVTGSGGSDATGGSTMPTGGTTATGGASPTGGAAPTGGASPVGGSGGSGLTGGDGSLGGSGGSGATATGGSAGDATVTGGTGGSAMPGGTGGGGTGMGGGAGMGPYAARSGSFKMLVYSRTVAFRHDGSIASGKQMLQQIATEQGFQITVTEANTDITAAGLAQYEIVFFMNPTGDIFNATEQAAFEEWITTKNGAFAGVHSATDTEEGWTFYKELTGQYYNGHGAANTPGGIQFDAAMLSHPALRTLPNPWQRNEEWYLFNNFQQWSSKPGFQMLGRKQSDNQPIMWIREWGNFRAFYTAIGHDAAVFQDANVKKHLTGGILWAVRRDHLIR